MPTIEIPLLPKQSELYNELKFGDASVIGIGGGRGCGKSLGLDSVLINLMLEEPNLKCCIVMRNFDQVYKYHIETIKEHYPVLMPGLKVSSPASLRIGKSQCDFSYAETFDDVKRRFMSGNYQIIALDQAEQFSEEELKEIRKSCRSTKGPDAKLILSFNMRGSSIQFLRKWFDTHEVDDPEDFKFLKVNPWDNYFWSAKALERDGYTVDDYYNWTDDQRKEYAAKNGKYTKQLANDDNAAIRAADWEGSWESVEGTFFANSWDLNSVQLDSFKCEKLMKPWATHWLSQDWARNHYAVTYWHYKVAVSPTDVNSILGWNITKPINVIVTYREMIVNDRESIEVAQFIADSTPLSERKKIRAFFLSPDAFGVKDSTNTVAVQEGKILRANDLPFPTEADNELVGGWSLMGKLLKSTKGKGFIKDLNDNMVQVDDVWLISSECPELLKSIPLLMRDPKRIDIVHKTDTSSAKIEMDCADSARYGLKSMLAPRKKTTEDIFNEQMAVATPAQQMLINYKHEMDKKKRINKKFQLPPSWQGNLRK